MTNLPAGELERNVATKFKRAPGVLYFNRKEGALTISPVFVKYQTADLTRLPLVSPSGEGQGRYSGARPEGGIQELRCRLKSKSLASLGLVCLFLCSWSAGDKQSRVFRRGL